MSSAVPAIIPEYEVLADVVWPFKRLTHYIAYWNDPLDPLHLDPSNQGYSMLCEADEVDETLLVYHQSVQVPGVPTCLACLAHRDAR